MEFLNVNFARLPWRFRLGPALTVWRTDTTYLHKILFFVGLGGGSRRLGALPWRGVTLVSFALGNERQISLAGAGARLEGVRGAESTPNLTLKLKTTADALVPSISSEPLLWKKLQSHQPSWVLTIFMLGKTPVGVCLPLTLTTLVQWKNPERYPSKCFKATLTIWEKPEANNTKWCGERSLFILRLFFVIVCPGFNRFRLQDTEWLLNNKIKEVRESDT